MAEPVTLALVADIHCRVDVSRQLKRGLSAAAKEADILVLGGDLCNMGREEESQALQDILRDIEMPIVAVLGNHDYHNGQAALIVKMLEDIGVYVLQGNACEIEVKGARVGFAGAKGFCGGYGTYCLTPFGEDGIKKFIGETYEDAKGLEAGLQSLSTDYRVVVLHYAPISQTLFGEPTELYPFLGSSILAEPIDRLGCDLVVHGHAHHGVEDGETQAGIPVKNAAMPVIKRPYILHVLDSNNARRGGQQAG